MSGCCGSGYWLPTISIMTGELYDLQLKKRIRGQEALTFYRHCLMITYLTLITSRCEQSLGLVVVITINKLL